MQTKRPRSLLRAITVAAALVNAATAPAADEQPADPPPPNVIVILADDAGYGDYSFVGNTNLSTPAIDSLARDGALAEEDQARHAHPRARRRDRPPADAESVATQAAGRTIFASFGGKVSVRTQTHRLDADGRLYDMAADPGQTRDRVAMFPEETARLRSLAAAWRRDVLTAGTYDAVIWYTCPEADTGSTVTLACGALSTQATIHPGWDPPTAPDKDRVPRQGEGFDKDFRPLALGRIELAEGPATLTLRATTIPGGSVADVRRLVLVPTRR